MSSVTDLQDAVGRVEESYEFMISFAGQGIGREIEKSNVEQVREFIVQFEEALDDALDAAERIDDEFDLDGGEHYDEVIDEFATEVTEAQSILKLLAAQEQITSQQVDNLNGMSVFQSVMMKLFFLDDLTEHHDLE